MVEQTEDKKQEIFNEEHKLCKEKSGENPMNLDCAICLACPNVILLPCCGNLESSTRFCFACIKTYCDENNGIANCPKCRKPLQVIDGQVKVSERRGRCSYCC